MRISWFYLLSTFCFTGVYAQSHQSIKKDSLESRIDEVVVTGQYGISTIKKSLYKVEVITREDISRMAQNNVAEVLNQTLNILIIPERNSGNSKANIMGLGANYTKILVDNIPLVGDEGLGSNIDLTKINLDNVERIEIVKGSMGVEFGNSAMAGVINIITKKSDLKKWNIRGFVQEETVGKEYDWVDYGKGKHIQSLAISHNISPKWFANVAFNRNDFQGFWGEQQGKNYFEQNSKRGYEWQPKEQINATLGLKYNTEKTQIFYKADFLTEEVNYYNPLVETLSLGGGNRTFTAKDRDYNTERWLNHLGINTSIFRKTKLSLDVSHQKQTRKNQDKIFDIPNRKIYSTDPENTYYQSETLYSRGNIFNFLDNERLDAQVGYEVDYTKGFAGWSTGSYDGKNVENKVFSGGVFASAEFKVSNRWFLRPGFRYNFSDVFKAKPTFSLVMKNSLTERSEIRAIIGSSNRNPTFEELFTYFVDANHDVQGNRDLRPENSYSGSIYYTIHSERNSPIKWSIDLNTMYLQVRDKISVSVVDTMPLKYKFINIDTFESWLNSASARLKINNLSLNAGISLVGRSQQIYDQIKGGYNYHTEANASLYYDIPKTKTSFTVLYRGIGSAYEVVEDKSLGITEYLLSKRNGFSLLDASISQKFWKNHFTLTMGVRNLLDINSVKNQNVTTGAHGAGASSQMLFYGRSYFARMNFNF